MYHKRIKIILKKNREIEAQKYWIIIVGRKYWNLLMLIMIHLKK
jgi:hypothetical protein